jgi:hypothetical protein
MTTYTFMAGSSYIVDWSLASVWAGGVVPNSADADVVFPTLTVVSDVSIANGETYAVNSLSISNNSLSIKGTLSVSHALTLQHGGEIDMGGGSLSVGSVQNDGDIQGSGQIFSSGTLTNETLIVGNGLNLTLAGLVNTGTLIAASGDLTVNVSGGGFTNLSGTTLTGGTYEAGYSRNTSANSNTLYLNVGGLIVTDAANITLDDGGVIASFDNNSGSYIPLQSTLRTIASSGALTLAKQNYDWNWDTLTVDGVLTLSNNATLNANQLTVDAVGQISGNGKIAAPIANAGIIVAGNPSSPGYFQTRYRWCSYGQRYACGWPGAAPI